MSESSLTVDSPADGVYIYQPARGYRYAMDPILLVGWALEIDGARTFLDIGTGSGLMALLLTRQGLVGRGIDAYGDWIPLARMSAERSGLSTVFAHEDARNLRGVSVDLVVCNPPYFPWNGGTLPKNGFRAAGRHECAGSLAELIGAACAAGDRVCISINRARKAEVEELLRRNDRTPWRYLELDEGIVLMEGSLRHRGLGREQGSLRGPAGHSPLAHRLFTAAGARLSGGGAA